MSDLAVGKCLISQWKTADLKSSPKHSKLGYTSDFESI